QAVEGLGQVVDVAAITRARLVQVTRLVEGGEPGAGGVVRGVAQLQRARHLHLADPDPGAGEGPDDISRIFERDRLVAEVVAEAQGRVDQLRRGPGGR